MCRHPCVVHVPTTALHMAVCMCPNAGQGIRSRQWTGLFSLPPSLILSVVAALVVVVVVLVGQLDPFWKRGMLKNRNHRHRRPEGSGKEEQLSFSWRTPQSVVDVAIIHVLWRKARTADLIDGRFRVMCATPLVLRSRTSFDTRAQGRNFKHYRRHRVVRPPSLQRRRKQS